MCGVIALVWSILVFDDPSNESEELHAPSLLAKFESNPTVDEFQSQFYGYELWQKIIAFTFFFFCLLGDCSPHQNTLFLQV